MRKMFGYELDEDDYEYLCDLRAMLIDGQSSANLVCEGYQFGVYALGERLEVCRFNEKLALFDNFEDFVLHFEINGKPLIEQIKLLDFDE